jgi:glycosyltransferase involved in cell wall biosynthesis
MTRDKISIKVLHLCSSTGFFGAENVIIELAKNLKMFGYEPIVGVFNNLSNPNLELAHEAKKNGLQTKIFLCKKKFDFNTIKKIRSCVKKNNVKILHTHGYKSNLYGLLGSTNKCVKVATNHAWVQSNHKTKIYCLLDYFFIRFFKKIIAVSDQIHEEIKNKGIISKKIELIYNGIDVQKFENKFDNDEIKSEFSISAKSKVVGTVGSLNIVKGHIYFIEAAKEVLKSSPDTKFLIVGDGPLRKKLEEKTKKLKIERNVIFAGLIKDMPKIYSLIDVLVIPSLSEGMPMVLLEAMAAGKPVIATNVGSISKALVDQHTGILIKPKDVDNLKNAILYILKNESTAKAYGYNGWKKVQNDFLAVIMCKKYISVYKEVLSQI